MASRPHYTADEREEYVKKIGSKVQIKPQGLSIVWGRDERYWRLPKEKSEEPAAELLQVCWLEVSGSVDIRKICPNKPAQAKKCRISFEVEMKPDAFGWNNLPVYVMAKVGKKGKYSYESANLFSVKTKSTIPIDKALEIEFQPDAYNEKIYFGLYEVWSGRWKGGLLIREAVIELKD